MTANDLVIFIIAYYVIGYLIIFFSSYIAGEQITVGDMCLFLMFTFIWPAILIVILLYNFHDVVLFHRLRKKKDDE